MKDIYGVKFNVLVIAIFFAAYLLNQTVLKEYTGHPFVHWYLNDILAPPILLAYANILFSLSPFSYRLVDLVPILLFVLAVGLFWEFITPVYYPVRVGDWLDILAYGAGGMIYYLVCRRIAVANTSKGR